VLFADGSSDSGGGSKTEAAKVVVNTIGDGVNQLIGHVIQLFVWIGGQLLAVLMYLLFLVAKYNSFIDSPAVATGWFIARDLCNIFFIVIFLVMTVGTVLGIENYHYSQILTKLLIMTVLINFSKMICGLIIDVAQVIMMTFINNFGKLGSGYLTEVLGIQDLLGALKGNAAQVKEINFFTMAGSYILVLIYVIVAIATILVLLLVLVQRMVMIWIYVVLSPLAYLLSTFPAGAQYASKWWSEFVKYVTIGPIIAFFLWLSFVSLSNTNTLTELTTGKKFEDLSPTEQALNLSKKTPQAGITVAGSTDHMIKFIVAIAMLLGGLMVAQTIGGMAGNFAGSTISGLSTAGVGTFKTGLDWVNRKQAAITGQDLNVPRRWAMIKAGMEKNKAADIYKIEQRADRLHRIRGVGGALLGTGARDWYEQRVQGYLGLKGAWAAARGTWRPAEEDAEEASAAKKRADELRKQKEKVMTEKEYHGQLRDRVKETKEARIERGKYAHEVSALDTEIADIKVKLGGLISPKVRDDLNAELAKKEADKKATENKVKESDEKYANAKKQIFEYQDKRKKGEMDVVSDDKAKKARIGSIDSDVEKEQEKYRKAMKSYGKYIIRNPEAQKARRVAESEELSKLSDDSTELRADYRNAIERGQHAKASVILKKLAQNVDTNETLEDFGYNTNKGLTKEELKKLQDAGDHEAIRVGRGLQDFIRDTLVEKAGMDEQMAYALESELGQIHKATGQGAYIETAGFKDGRYIQYDYADQGARANIHLMKQGPEKLARSGNRFAFGGEDVDGNFKVHAAGLNLLMSKFDIIAKEIERGRLNPYNAVKLTEAPNMKIMRDAAKMLTGANRVGYEKMLAAMQTYGKQVRGGTGDLAEQIGELGKVIKRA